MKYTWDAFPIGETRAFAHCYRSAVITSFRSWCKSRKLDWEISTISDPPSPKRGQPCNMVWATRIEPRRPEAGISEGETDELGSLASRIAKLELPKNWNFKKEPPIILDIRDIPVESRIKWYDILNPRIRQTRKGWDRFAVNQWARTSAKITDVRKQIIKTCLARNLTWRWELRRIENDPRFPDTGKRVVWYLITRLR